MQNRMLYIIAALALVGVVATYSVPEQGQQAPRSVSRPAPSSLPPAVQQAPRTDQQAQRSNQTSAIDELIEARKSKTWVELDGEVSRILRDDNEGSRHQRFILSLASRRTLLIAHNIDLAERVPVREGDRVRMRGRYEWNDKGGVIHWTHHDPRGRIKGGWIEHQGKRYR